MPSCQEHERGKRTTEFARSTRARHPQQSRFVVFAIGPKAFATC
jgi:hypothetical protein